MQDTMASAASRCPCRVKLLPPDLLEKAAQVAIATNLVNAPVHAGPPSREQRPIPWIAIQKIVKEKTLKYWKSPHTLTVSFMEAVSDEIADKILGHMNSWNVGITFDQVSQPGQAGDVRITFAGPGYSSLLGTDILVVDKREPTMCLEGFNLPGIPDEEYRRVVRHEAGHTLGFDHEHLRHEVVSKIDPAAAYAYYEGPPNNWKAEEVYHNVLRELPASELISTDLDTTSIMCYALPAEIMKEGNVGVPGGTDINDNDRSFALQLYPCD